MTEQELQQQRARLWRVDGNPIRTIEDAKSFLDSVGFCLVYPGPFLPLVPSFFAAYAGSTENLPDAKHAFADPRNAPATELMVRLLRERHAYEVNLLPESTLLVSAAFFPFMYALFGDRKPKAPPRGNARGGFLSPLTIKVFETIKERGPLTKAQLREHISRELTEAAIERSLNELWSLLRIARVDYREGEGASWDLLYRWSPKAVQDGLYLSDSEALSALLGRYLEAVVAAPREDVEQFFSHLSPRSKVREAINALLATRELSFIAVGNKTLLRLSPVPESHQRRIHG